MPEYHINVCPTHFEPYIAPKNKCLHANLSHWFPTNRQPVIIIGQDESIFKPYSSSARMWHGSDGRSTLVPKDDGHGVMISAIVNRTWGFRTNGNQILPEQFHEINQLRLHPSHNTYILTEAALNVNGHTAKGPIEDCGAFCRLFEYSANNDGYWNYNTMALQMEDFIDCIRVLVPDHDFVILYDQKRRPWQKAS